VNSLQTKVKTYLEERGWDKLRPGDLAKSISIEAAELLEHFQWHNPELEEVRKDSEKIAELKKRIG
jgi:hypothetical protein